MLTVEFTEAEAQVVADVVVADVMVAWGADDCPVGAIDADRAPSTPPVPQTASRGRRPLAK